MKLLGIEDLFEGITFCDYEIVPFVCKPQVGMFEKAMREAGVVDVGGCFFVGELTLLWRDADEFLLIWVA